MVDVSGRRSRCTPVVEGWVAPNREAVQSMLGGDVLDRLLLHKLDTFNANGGGGGSGGSGGNSGGGGGSDDDERIAPSASKRPRLASPSGRPDGHGNGHGHGNDVGGIWPRVGYRRSSGGGSERIPLTGASQHCIQWLRFREAQRYVRSRHVDCCLSVLLSVSERSATHPK